jgi:hypothetical protein
MEETVLRVLRMLADGVIGPRVHELLDELEAAPAPPAPHLPPAVPAAVSRPFQAPVAPIPTGGKS